MEVLKNGVVTGSTSDIGTELCRLLLKQGYRLLTIDRDQERALRVKAILLKEFPNSQIENYTANLAESTEITAVGELISSQHDSVDLLFHNAGVLTATKTFNQNDIELHFAVNSLAPYLLTKQLMPLLCHGAGAKVVISGSGASNMAKVIKVDQLIDPDKFKGMTGSYAQSKAAVKVLFSYLQKQTLTQNVKYSVVDLPPTKTKMTKSPALPIMLKCFSFLFLTPEKSAYKLFQARNNLNVINITQSQESVSHQLVNLVETLICK